MAHDLEHGPTRPMPTYRAPGHGPSGSFGSASFAGAPASAGAAVPPGPSLPSPPHRSGGSYGAAAFPGAPTGRTAPSDPDLRVLPGFPGAPATPTTPTGQLRRARERSRELATEPLSISLDIARVRTWLTVLTVALVVLDVLASVGSTVGAPYVATRFFDGDAKTNVPSGYKILGLCAAALLAAALARSGRESGDRFTPGWRIIAWVAAFACFDETTLLHQSLSGVLTTRLHLHGALKYSWAILYLPAVVAVGIAMIRYVRHLAPGLRLRLLAGGAIYAFGAVAFEPVKSEFSEDFGENSLLFKLAAAASDSMEMIGITVLVVVLLGRLAATRGAVVLHRAS